MAKLCVFKNLLLCADLSRNCEHWLHLGKGMLYNLGGSYSLRATHDAFVQETLSQAIFFLNFRNFHKTLITVVEPLPYSRGS